jgi:hypothetical protein
MISYKVVDKETRYGSNVAMFLNRHKTYRLNDYSYFKSYIKEYKLNKFMLKYDVGSEIQCHPNTPGIMCFTDKKWAEKFIDDNWTLLDNSEIIEVEGEELIRYDYFWGQIGCGGSLVNLTDKKTLLSVISVEGLVTFKKVKVLS